MTGIEHLRRLARSQNMDNAWTAMLAHELCDIADQIEREIQASNEGEKVKCDHAADVSMSAYDLLPEEDRDAIAWVRDHGGLDAVREKWDGRVDVDVVSRMVEGHKAKREMLKAHALGLERKCADRGETIRGLRGALARTIKGIQAQCEALGVDVSGCETADDMLHDMNEALSLRLMPDGMEWPAFEDGEPIRIGDEVVCDGRCSPAAVDFIELNGSGFKLYSKSGHLIAGADLLYGNRVKRHAPKVLDADGAEIEVGEDLYSVEGSLKFHVSHIDRVNGKIATAEMYALDKWADPAMYTHRAPVIAADGKPLREGETVWLTDGSERHVVLSTEKDSIGNIVTEVQAPGLVKVHISPSRLTHERPVSDTWERLEEDAKKLMCDYFGHDGGETCETCPGYTDSTPQGGRGCRYSQMADLVRRAKALAERDAK